MAEDFYDRLEPKVFKTIARRINNAKKILEIGCGDCRLANYLARHIGCTVIGVDKNDGDFTRGRREGQKLKVSDLVYCIKGDAEYLSSFLAEKFDVCISLYVLHELRKPLKVLKEIKRILNRNGKIIVIDFPKGSAAEELWGEEYYAHKKMEFYLKKCGFKRVNVEFFEGKELAYVTGEK